MINENAIPVEIGGLVDGVGAPIMRAAYQLKSKPSWITLSKAEGTGNTAVDVTAPKYDGRQGRSGEITVQSGDLSKLVSLSQLGSNIWDVITQSLAFIKTGESKNFEGNTNLASITFSVDSDASSWLTAGKCTVNEQQYDSGAPIEGDPGSTSLYSFSIQFTATPNTGVDSRTGHITVNGQQYEVVQAAGDATLTVTPDTLEFSAAGETKQITINSNTSWTIS